MANNITDIGLPPIFNFYFKQGLHGYIVGIFIGALISFLAKLVNIPHQIPTALSAIIIGIAARYIGSFDDLVLNPHLLQSTYIPLLVAKMVYNMDHYLLIKSLPQILVIAVIGNTLFVAIFGMILSLFQKQENYLFVMLISVMVAPNDNPELPIVDGIKNLETLMYGETLLGVAVCNVARIILTGVGKMYITEYYHVIGQILRYIGVSIPIGFFCGWALSLLFRELYNDSMNAVAAYLSASYFAYILCEHIAWCNGTLGAFITLYIMTTQRSRFFAKTDHDIKLCCNVAYTLVQSLIAIFAIAEGIYSINEHTFAGLALEGCALYIMAHVTRLVIFLMASPILSRMGYGFEFASLVTLFWAVQKGVIQLLQVEKFASDPGNFVNMLDAMNVYILIYVILTCLVNATTLKIFLKAFGLIKLSNRRKANIANAINQLNEIGGQVLASLKGIRYYSDVNWSVITTHTALKNQFEDFANLGIKDNVVCNVCSAVVPMKPTKDEYNEHLKDVTMRVLKAQRVSFLEQHELGLLSKEDVEALLQAVDIAMDSTNMCINMDSLVACMDAKKMLSAVTRRVRKILTIDSSIKIPKTTHRKRCYKITNSLIFEAIIIAVVATDFVIQILRLSVSFTKANYVLLIFAIICYAFYIMEAVLRILSCANGTFREALKYYFSVHWNRIDAIVIVVATVDIIAGILYLSDVKLFLMTKHMRWIKIIVCLKLFRILLKIYPIFVASMERRNDLKLMKAFAVAQGIVLSCDEVISILPTLTEQSNIREVIKRNLEEMRARITQKMGILEKARPSLTTTIKTRQALRCILKHLNEGIRELRSSGLIDAFEFQKLYQAVTLKSKCLLNVKILEVIQPTLIFKEIPWLYGNDELLDYIYRNVKNKIFNAGDVLCKPGDFPEGVYIIVAGYFKITYYPTPELITKLKDFGELPTKEHLQYLRFDEVHEDYLSCGNRMGEFAILTNRPYQCSIVSEAPSQVFIIPKEVFDVAKELSPDPVLGLCARIWKCVLFGLSRRLLLTTNAYQSSTKQEADYALIRSIVPNTDYYDVINLSQVDDVLLLEGMVTDKNTREVYVAPCALPRHIKKLLMPKSDTNVHSVKTKLMFIPDNNVDEYEMMLTIQKNSELKYGHGCTLLTENMNSKRRFESHMFSLSKPKSGTLSYCHKIMAFNGGALFYANEE